MEGLLCTPLSEREILSLGSLELAYVGDCAYELLVRTRILSAAPGTVQTLHQRTVRQVCAAGQAALAEQIEPLLTEREHDVFRRGRNVRHHRIPKGSSPAEYASATALEALFGYLYLSGQTQRLCELANIAQPRT